MHLNHTQKRLVLALDASKPTVAREILRTVGYERLGENYLTACQQYDRTAQALMQRHLRDPHGTDESFDALLASHPGIQEAKAEKARLWGQVEALQQANT